MNYHIEDLRNQLHNNDWNILKELEGNDLDISGYWIIKHLHYPNKFITLAFEGMDDLKVLPVESSYACFLSENPSISLYFSKNNPKAWKKKLDEFVSNMESYIDSNFSG